jgi:chromosome segregation protein
MRAADEARQAAQNAHRAAVRAADEATEAARRIELSIDRRRERPDEGPGAIRRAELQAELTAERRIAERAERERRARETRLGALREGIRRDSALVASAAVTVAALERAVHAVGARRDALGTELEADQERSEGMAAELRSCAHEEAALQGTLREHSQAVTDAEVAAQRLRDSDSDARGELTRVTEALGFPDGETEPAPEPLAPEVREELGARIARLARRREQLGPVNPLAKEEYEEAITHVEELEGQRTDLEAALAELTGLIKDTDRRIRESFELTFGQAAKNFEELVGHLFPGGRGRLRLVQPDGPRPVLGGEEGGEEPEVEEGPEAEEPGVEVEVTPAGKSTKRLSLLSGGEKSLVALAFMFAVFLAKPCPFYILDEVEAALDDLNIDRFLQLVRRYSDRAQFIVVTHQKRTMDAADSLYGVSMGQNGVSKVVSRKLGGKAALEAA